MEGAPPESVPMRVLSRWYLDGESARMTHINVNDTKKAKLPLRDWILLPLVGLLTICVLAGSVEFIGRRLFGESKTHLTDCLVVTDISTGVRAIPNSVCWEKTPESEPIEYKFDGCGYRSGTQCEPKPRGVYRIVVIGSSIAMGEQVPFQQSIAALVPTELSQQTGRNVQLYDEAMAWGFPRTTALHFKDVLDATPDLILWVVTPRDVKTSSFTIPPSQSPAPRESKFISHVFGPVNKLKTIGFAGSVRVYFNGTRSAMMLQHFLCERRWGPICEFVLARRGSRRWIS